MTNQHLSRLKISTWTSKVRLTLCFKTCLNWYLLIPRSSFRESLPKCRRLFWMIRLILMCKLLRVGLVSRVDLILLLNHSLGTKEEEQRSFRLSRLIQEMIIWGSRRASFCSSKKIWTIKTIYTSITIRLNHHPQEKFQYNGKLTKYSPTKDFRPKLLLLIINK